MLDFVFIEYSFDPETQDSEEVFSALGRLGFILRSEHESERASFWTQNQSIFLVHERPGSGCRPGISGLGFMGLNNHVIDMLDAQYEADTSAYVYDNQGAFRTLIIPAEVTANVGGIIKYSMVSSAFEKSYQVVDKSHYTYPGLTHVSGIVYANPNQAQIEFYEKLGFRATKDSENHLQMLSNNDRFSLFIDKLNRENSRSILVCDTDDIFWTTACYAANRLNMTEFDLGQNTDFGSLTHKIVGYNCLAEGTRTSYNISNLIPQALPGLDLVFRMRKQFLGIPERILEIAHA